MWTLIIFLTIFTSFRDVSCIRKLQILHTNDMHARYLEVDEDSVTCAGTLSKENRCYGGFARVRQAAIQAKEEATKQNISTIFLNAGDTLTGTPYYSKYKWEITAPLADALQFDAMVKLSTFFSAKSKASTAVCPIQIDTFHFIACRCLW